MPGLWFQTKPASPSQTITQPSGRRRRFQSDYPMCRLSRSAASVALITRSRVSAVGKVQEVAACNAPSGAIPSFHRLVFVFVGTKKNVSKFGPKIGSAPPHGSATCARKNVECDQIRVSVSVRACTPSCWCFHNTFRHLCAFLWGLVGYVLLLEVTPKMRSQGRILYPPRVNSATKSCSSPPAQTCCGTETGSLMRAVCE